MKFTIALLVLCSLQNSLVLAITVDEVIDVFLPVIKVLHDELTAKADAMLTAALNNIEYIVTTARWNENNLPGLWDMVMEQIKMQFKKIVYETGMTNRPDKIVHCYDLVNAEYSKLQNMERSSVEVVSKAAYSAAPPLRKKANAVRDLQSPVHNSIDAGFTHCKNQGGTPVEMQLCLINHYTLSKTAVQQVFETMDTRMKKIKENSAGQHLIVINSFYIIESRARAVETPVLDVFRKCCIAASQTSQ